VSLLVTFTVLLLLPINNHAQHNDHHISPQTLTPKDPEPISQGTHNFSQTHLKRRRETGTHNLQQENHNLTNFSKAKF